MRYMYWRVPSRGYLWRRKVFYQPWSLHRVRYMRKRMSSGGYQPCWIISIIQGLTAGSVALSRFFGDIKTRLDGEYGSFGGKTEEHVFLKRQKNMRTCCCFEDMRTWEHVFVWKDKRTWEHVVVEKTEEHENMLFLKRQKNRRTGFLKTEEWVSVGGYGIPAIPTQTWVYKPIEWVWQGCHTLLQYLNFLLFYFFTLLLLNSSFTFK